MKKITLLLLLMAFKGLAQDGQLLNNTWYLHQMVIGGINYGVPQGVTTANATFYGESLSVNHPDCTESALYEMQYNDNSGFETTQPLILIGFGCSVAAEGFYAAHYSVYMSSPLTYAISTAGNAVALVVTNANGDQAVYGDQPLATKSFSTNAFAVYPNPASDELRFSGLAAADIVSVQIFDALGKTVSSANTIGGANTINVGGLAKGVYVVSLQRQDGTRINRKFLKD